MKNILSGKLRALRVDSGLTQKELATKISSTDKNIWAYENNIATPPLEILIAYSKFFECSTDYLLGLEDDFGTQIKFGVTSQVGERLTEKEKTMIEAFRQLLPETQDFILRSAQSLCDKKTVTKQ